MSTSAPTRLTGERRQYSLNVAPPLLDPPPEVGSWTQRLARRLFLLDAAIASSLMAMALVVADVHRRVSTLAGAAGLLLIWLAFLVSARSFDRRIVGIGPEEYKRVAAATARFWMLAGVASYLAERDGMRLLIAILLPGGTVALVIGRWAARKVLHQTRRRTAQWSHRVLVVGGREETLHLMAQVRREPYAGMHVVGACLSDGGSSLRITDGVPVLGDLSRVAAAARAVGADTVAVTPGPGLTGTALKRLGWELEGSGIDLVVAPGLTDVAGPRVHVRPLAGLPLLYVEQPEYTGGDRFVKTAMDFLVATVFVVLLMPLMVGVAIAIKVTSPGPVIFRQTRIGRNGATFTLFKFRSMVTDAEARLTAIRTQSEGAGLLFKMRDDPRVTKVGRWLRRFSIDELPQLFNVLRGDMSLIGPRPALPSEAEKYGADVARRLLVKPGITGLWQVSGRSDLSWEDSVRLDLYYVENWSLTSDVQILWKTVSAVLASRGAY